jgi:hypothetical protein
MAQAAVDPEAKRSTPGEYPGEVLSEMGRRVRDLTAEGYSYSAIARHCGCDPERIRELVVNPNCSPRYTTGEMLIRLHENVVLYGLSHWARMILALRVHGFTFQQIAERVGSSEEYIRLKLRDPSKIPNHALGDAIVKMYKTHVRQFL